MSTIEQTIWELENELSDHKREYESAHNRLEAILANAEAEGRSRLTEHEDQMGESLLKQKERASAAKRRVENMLTRARNAQAEDASPAPATREFKPAPRIGSTRRSAEFSIGDEPRVYNEFTDPAGKLFLSDVANQFRNNDMQSTQRLSRHMQEERVERPQYLERTSAGVGTGAFTGLVVPQYLIDLVAPAVANLRPFADMCNKHPLPENGMSVNISRITTASSAALQANELDTVSMTDMDDTLLTVAVQTAAGSQIVSRQALDRGQGIEDTVMGDLVARYYTVLDNTLLNQSVHGMTNVAHDNDNTTATPSAVYLYPSIVGAASQVTGALLGYGAASHAIMHPRRWYWLQSQLITSWPAFSQPSVASDGLNVGANSGRGYNSGSAGVLPCGVEVIIDANVTTSAGGTQDEIYVVPWRECHLWETPGAPIYVRAEAMDGHAGASGYSRLGVTLVVYGYFAYTFERYANAMQKISDTGLAQPVGF